MKIGILTIGILLVIGVVIEHGVESNVINEVQNLTNLQDSALSKLSQTLSNTPYGASGNTGLDASSLALVSSGNIQQLQKMLEFGTFGTGIMGVSFMVYGLVSKPKKKSSSYSPSDLLKMRLVKGEITKEEFDSIKTKLEDKQDKNSK